MTFLDSIPPLQKLAVALTSVILLLFLLFLVRTINSNNNNLEWWHLFSTRGADGKPYADWDKIGKGVGVMMCIWLPAVYVYSSKMEAMGLAAVMGVALGYLGAVSGYAATLRSKQGTVVTEKVTEPAAPVPAKVTTTKTETPPVHQGTS
jgi:hypothetical protein